MTDIDEMTTIITTIPSMMAAITALLSHGLPKRNKPTIFTIHKSIKECFYLTGHFCGQSLSNSVSRICGNLMNLLKLIKFDNNNEQNFLSEL